MIRRAIGAIEDDEAVEREGGKWSGDPFLPRPPLSSTPTWDALLVYVCRCDANGSLCHAQLSGQRRAPTCFFKSAAKGRSRGTLHALENCARPELLHVHRPCPCSCSARIQIPTCAQHDMFFQMLQKSCQGHRFQARSVAISDMMVPKAASRS